MRRARRAAPLFAVAVALLLSHTAAAVDWSKARTVNVTTTEYAFTPNRLTFKTGATYRLHLVNSGKETHEFTAPEFFKAIKMRNPEVVNADRTEIVVRPGDKKDLFFVASMPGSFPLRCSDHDWAGMVGNITVAP